ncbi:ABC transporter ATP-binding protein [Pseudoclostridium thermosuccinogenes]|uniref:ABC transporter ATP-binding protein n=1 Tax=Clostridium thermosuccinogenes TaxID=84032 RepID=UPI002FDAFB94
MKKITRYINLLLRNSPALVILLAILTVCSFVLPPLHSLLDKLLFDTVQQDYRKALNWSSILFIVFLYFAYNLGVYVIFKAKDFISDYTQIKLNASIQKKVMAKINQITYDKYEDNNFYNYLTAIESEINEGNVLGIFVNTMSMFGALLSIVYLSCIMLSLGIIPMLLSSVCCIPGFIHQATFGKKNWEFNTSKIPLQRKTLYIFSLLSSIDSYKENRIYDTFDHYKKKYSHLLNEYYEELKSFNLKNCWKGIIMATIHSLGTVSVIAYAYFQAANNRITLGDAVLFVGVTQSIYNYIQNVIYYIGNLNETGHSVDNLLSFISDGEGENTSKPVEKQCADVFIELKNVKYAYPNMENNILDGIDLTIHQNEKIAIVGENGCGKTTLAKIILGLYHPKEGTVKLNGVDLNEVKQETRYATVCFQDYFTYSFTVRENVAFGNIEKLHDDNSILNAIKMSQLEFDIFNHDLGKYINKEFDTKGIVLSGGQAQKLSLSRAFLFDKGLIILDEPSASLDVITENEIFESTLALMKDRAAIVITHRLANVINCDTIIYLENGKVCEKGTHDELMKLKGKYYNLFSIQANKYKAKA